jgi:segregation and condensation protein B
MDPKTNRYEWVTEQRKGKAVILEHMTLVKRTAVYLRPRIPDYIELNDMIQLGIIGLLEAEKTFDPSQGISFQAYAKIRIRGAIIDEARKLSRAAIETLAIIAYHQPVTRPEIEEIRGATLSQATLDALLDMALITSRGKKEVPGRPTLWGTTPRFLEQFGLKSLADLPRREDLVSNDAALPLIPASAPEQGE